MVSVLMMTFSYACRPFPRVDGLKPYQKKKLKKKAKLLRMFTFLP